MYEIWYIQLFCTVQSIAVITDCVACTNCKLLVSENGWRPAGPTKCMAIYLLTKSTFFFFYMCSAVSAGVCPVDLSLRNPGVINHSRWLTMAYRILRLYVARVNPSDELKALVSFMNSLCLHVVRNKHCSVVEGWCWTCVQYNPEITLPHRWPEESCRSCNPTQRFL